MLAGANPDGRASFRHPIPGNVKLGDVAPAIYRGRQQPQQREVQHEPDTTPDRLGALHQDQLCRRALDAELKGKLASRIGNSQIHHRAGAENRLRWRRVELWQAKIGAPGVQAYEELEAIKPHPLAFVVYEVCVGREDAPCPALLQAQRPPTAGDREDVTAVALLVGGSRVRWGHERTHDIPVPALHKNDVPLPARLWNRLDLHVISGTRLLRAWFTARNRVGVATIAKPSSEGQAELSLSAWNGQRDGQTRTGTVPDTREQSLAPCPYREG